VDKFHVNSEEIYRVTYNLYEEGVLEFSSAAAVPAIGPEMKKEYPEVENFTRFMKAEATVSRNNVKFKESKILFAEPSFFDIFSFPIIEGTTDSTVLNINQMVITREAAHRYFGNESPIGKFLTLNGREKYSISAVAADPPSNSHLDFEFLISMKNLERGIRGLNSNWYLDRFYTYIQLNKESDYEVTEAKIPSIVEKHQGDYMRRALFLREFKLQPLKDIHLKSNLKNEFKANGNYISVISLGIIAILVLLISFINYINLSVSNWIDKLGDTGIRKIMGATLKHIVLQTSLEAIVAIVFSAIISITMVILVLSGFNSIMELNLALDLPLIMRLLLPLFLLGITVGGIIPGYFLQRVIPVSALKGKSATGNIRYKTVRNSLVIFQFAASIVLIIGTIVISEQLSFMKRKNLGVDINQVLVVKSPSVANDSIFHREMAVLKSSKEKYPFIKNITSSSSIPGKEITFKAAFGKVVAGTNTEKTAKIINIDSDFIDTYKLNLIAGRNFANVQLSERGNIILNESAVRYFNFDSPDQAVDKMLGSGNRRFRVIGIIKDFNQMSLKQSPEPLVFFNNSRNGFLSIRFDANEAQTVVSLTNQFWNDIFPNDTFDYYFLDNYFNAQYKSEQRFGKLFNLASILVILIACIGLSGLSLQNIILRIKEIGVRKVNGAKVSEILVMLNTDLIKLVAISFIIAVPIAYLAMGKWLNNFAYKTDMSWMIFALAGMLVLGIALITVSWQSWRAATRNPVEALRYE
jgi:putative ABC transport system permease protein